MAADDDAGPPPSQTLDRGLRILEHLAAVSTPQTVMDIATGVDLHRSITYRLLRTLETHELVERDAAGRYWLGVGISALAQERPQRPADRGDAEARGARRESQA